MGIVSEALIEGLNIPGLTDEDKEKLRVKYARWDRLLDRGMVFDLTIKAWRAVCYIDDKAMAYMGIPLDEEEERKSYRSAVKMGQISLLPADVLKQQNRLESSARAALDRVSRPLFGHFVPEPLIPPLRERLKEIQADYYTFAKEEVVAKLDQHKEAMRANYRVIFGRAYDRLCAAGATPDVGRDEFISNATYYVWRNMPSEQDIEEAYSFDYDMEFVPFQDQVAELEARRAKLEEEAAQSDERARLITQQTQAVIEEELRVKAQSRAAGVLQSIDEAEQAMIKVITEAIQDLLTSLTANGVLLGRSSTQLANMLSQVKSFRDAGMLVDDDLDESIDSLDKMVGMFMGLKTEERKIKVPSLQDSLRGLQSSIRRVGEGLPQMRTVRREAAPVEEAAVEGERQVRQAMPIEEEAYDFGERKTRALPTLE